MTSFGVPVFTEWLGAAWQGSRNPETGRPYTAGELAAALNAAGLPCSESYLRRLRAGTKTSPSIGLVLALADVFDRSLEELQRVTRNRADYSHAQSVEPQTKDRNLGGN